MSETGIWIVIPANVKNPTWQDCPTFFDRKQAELAAVHVHGSVRQLQLKPGQRLSQTSVQQVSGYR
jgi:hypothetical protein